MSRRLIGHCQAIRDDQAKSRALTRWPTGGNIIEGADSTRLMILPKIQKNGPRSATDYFEQLGVNAEPALQVTPCRRVQIHEKVSWQKRPATMGKIGTEAWVQDRPALRFELIGSCFDARCRVDSRLVRIGGQGMLLNAFPVQ